MEAKNSVFKFITKMLSLRNAVDNS